MGETAKAKRKPLRNTLRFEVFKRDEFTCQYCGSHPPSVVLHVDHITPVSLGGENEIDNLVTACFTCNSGKGVRALSRIPRALSAKAKEVAEREAQIQGYNAITTARRERIEGECWRIVRELFGQKMNSIAHNKFEGIRVFIEKLGLDLVIDGANLAWSRRPYSEHGRFLYFCGVCWKRIRDAEGAGKAA